MIAVVYDLLCLATEGKEIKEVCILSRVCTARMEGYCRAYWAVRTRLWWPTLFEGCRPLLLCLSSSIFRLSLWARDTSKTGEGLNVERKCYWKIGDLCHGRPLGESSHERNRVSVIYNNPQSVSWTLGGSSCLGIIDIWESGISAVKTFVILRPAVTSVQYLP